MNKNDDISLYVKDLLASLDGILKSKSAGKKKKLPASDPLKPVFDKIEKGVFQCPPRGDYMFGPADKTT